jgi:hypothetical protein
MQLQKVKAILLSLVSTFGTASLTLGCFISGAQAVRQSGVCPTNGTYKTIATTSNKQYLARYNLNVTICKQSC